MAERWPGAARVYCSTGGQIAGTEVLDGVVVVTVVRFGHTSVRAVSAPLAAGDDGTRLAAELAAAIPRDGLRHVLVFGEALRVNGHAFVSGLTAALGARHDECKAVHCRFWPALFLSLSLCSPLSPFSLLARVRK